MTTTFTSKEQIMQTYNVTDAQIAACSMIEQTSPIHQVFYLVESATKPGVEYKVSFNREHGGLQCSSWNDGPHCEASLKGIPCHHKRAAVAAWELFKLEQRRRRLNEQARIEATEEYRQEQQELSAIQAVIDEAEAALAVAESDSREACAFSHEADSREARAVARYGLNACQPNEIRRDEQGRILR